MDWLQYAEIFYALIHFLDTCLFLQTRIKNLLKYLYMMARAFGCVQKDFQREDFASGRKVN